MTGTTLTADDLAAQLDQRGEPWDLYRGKGDGDGPIWVVCLGRGVDTRDRDDVRRFQARTLLAVLEEAVNAGPPLPVVPRQPPVMARSSFTARKDGSHWRLDYPGRPYYGRFATKKAAEAAADNITARAVRESEEWAATHGIWLACRTEGVDFRWAS